MVAKKAQKIKNRSGIFPCEICKEPNILQTHHINGRDIPNFDQPWNRVSICNNCHAKIHYGRLIIEKWVTTTNGKQLIWHTKEENSFTGENANPPLLI